MVRDTERGLRYLVPDEESGTRVVKEELDPSRLLAVGGLFYDDSQDYPLPLAGVNWISFDFRGTGAQTNLFIAGPLILADVADPSFFGSKFDFGIDVFALAFAGEDQFFQGDREIEGQAVETLRPNIDVSIGRPLGQFGKLDFEYSLAWNKFTRADETAAEFVLPEDHLSHSFELEAKYNRSGYRFRASGSHTIRSDWEPWGLPGNPDFDPDKDEFQRWGAGIAKTWHLPKFTKFGVELEYAGGDNLDRFSKYQFGYFSNFRVHGYSNDKIRAEEASAVHLSYGVNIADLFRLDLVGDAAWATDEATALDNELLAGVGVVGTFLGPWGTVVNMDVGVAVDGPDDGWSVFVAFLKLFNR